MNRAIAGGIKFSRDLAAIQFPPPAPLSELVLIVAERQSLFLLECRLRRRPTRAAFAFEGGAPSIALDIHLEDGRVMNKAIDGRQRHRLVREHLAPCAERLICGDQH